MQNGQVYRKGRLWMLRYWRDEIGSDGKVVRRRRAKKLAEYSDRYRSKKDLESEIAKVLGQVNARRPTTDVTIQEFIEHSYLPDVRAKKQPSTAKGYVDIYDDHIKRRLGGLRLGEFRTVDGQKMLDAIAHDNLKLSHMTLLHLKSFLSGVFSFARRVGAFDGANPLQGRGGIIVAGTRSQPTYAYNLSEIKRIINAVDNKTHRAIVIAAAFSGLSLSELRGLKWEDLDFKSKTITVNRKYWRNYEGETKTEARQAPVPMIAPVAHALRKHRKMNPGTIYIFEGPRHKPLDIATIGTKRIRPALEGTAIKWFGWHSFRRGLATNLRDLKIKDTIIQSILRHSNVATTQKSYIKRRESENVKAMRALGQAFKGG
jgi:integrase